MLPWLATTSLKKKMLINLFFKANSAVILCTSEHLQSMQNKVIQVVDKICNDKVTASWIFFSVLKLCHSGFPYSPE